jgi:DivIVA domain-containing protein
VRSASFPRRRRGFDEEEVTSFLDVVAGQIQAGNVERASMRAELTQLRDEVARLNEARQQQAQQQPVEPEVSARVEISVHAVSLLSQAQQAADSAVAEAEQYSRDLVTAARTQYQEILQRAQEAATNAVQQLPVAVEPEGVAQGYSIPVQEIEYVRTFAQVAQVQLRSVLDALTKEVDRLGQLPQLDNRPASLDLTEWHQTGVPNPRNGQ